MMARNPDVSHINERRLRPIYDCLDNGNNKKALQEADKVLKKQKDLFCAKVLKALALLRMGRQEESLQILHEVHSESPIDDSTLQAMTICYRELHKIELIADAYERAIKKDPTNEELHSHLFMAYVRLSDYKKQQMAAMSLYKLKPKNPYYFWAVMSILMQAISSKDQNIAQNIILPLAEKFCTRIMNKIEAEAEVELYLLILEKQNKYNEMLSLMESPIGAKLSNHLDFLSKKKADLFRLVDKPEEAFEGYKQLIDNNTDQIDYYLELIDISVELDNRANELLKDSSEAQVKKSCLRISQVVSFIEEWIKKGTNGSQRLRGPYLAKMVLFEHLTQRQKTDSDVDHLLKQMANSMTDLLFEYFVDFGSKQAAIYDMFYILDKTNLTEDDVQILTLQMKQSISKISEDYNDLNSMYKYLSYHYICHYLGQYDHLSRDNRSELVQQLTEKYENYYNNIVLKSDLTPTEPQPTDPFIILIANILFSGNELDDKIISETILILETTLTKSATNFHIKLLLIKLYNMLGAVSASHTLFDSLDIKHIQYDSLGYLFTTPLICGAHFTASSQLLGNALKFYSANFKDTLDYLISCYKFGSFTKVEEILKLRERLNNSLQYSLSAVERMILDLILEPKNHSWTERIINYMEIDCERDKFEWNDICDNRDFSVIRSHHQKNERIMREKQTQTFKDELLWLKIRNLIIRTIAASHNLITEDVHKKEIINNNNNSDKSGTETNGTEKRSSIDVLIQLSTQFREYLDLVKNSKFANPGVSLEGPNASRIEAFSNSSHFEVILNLIDFIIALNNEPKGDSFSAQIKSGDILASIVDDLEVCVTKNNNLLSIRLTLEQLTNTIETLSISIIFVGICQSIMKNKMNISAKKTKRKKDNLGTTDSLTASLLETYDSLINKLKESSTRIDKMLQSVNIVTIFSERFVSNSENDSVFSSVMEKVNKSYNQSIIELSELLQNKIVYLNSLQF